MGDVVKFGDRHNQHAVRRTLNPTPSKLDGPVRIRLKMGGETIDGDGISQELLGAIEGRFNLRAYLEEHVPPKEKKIQQWRSLVATYDNETLTSLVEKANEQQVKSKPAFFYALLDEANKRGLARPQHI